MICEGCGAPYSETEAACPYCGRPRPEPERVEVQITTATEVHKCPTCGSENTVTAVYANDTLGIPLRPHVGNPPEMSNPNKLKATANIFLILGGLMSMLALSGAFVIMLMSLPMMGIGLIWRSMASQGEKQLQSYAQAQQAVAAYNQALYCLDCRTFFMPQKDE